jgi:coenzyme F420 biosynthesis associated uncharacterized protein
VSWAAPVDGTILPAPADAAPPGTPGLVDWAGAERIGTWIAGRKPLPPGYDPVSVAADFDELTRQAEDLVAESTGLRSPTPARARVTDRPGWVRANVASMQRLLHPTLSRAEARRRNTPAGAAVPWLAGPLTGVSRTVTGAQLGLILAWVSTRVLGQYDLLLAEEAATDQDLVYFVGPNVVALENQHGFPSHQFRLWLALHEVTHRCQFTAVPWMRDHFVHLIDEGLEPLTADPTRLGEAIRRAADEVKAGRNPLADAGLLGLVATPDQLDALQRIQALMSLLEGHGDVTMDRAGAAEVPGAARFARVLRQRRQQVRGPMRLVHHAIGLEAKMRQYAEGETFVNEVEATGGTELLDRVWRGPEWLPSLAEIRDPGSWVNRVEAPDAVAG